MADDKVVDQVDQGISRLESEAYDPELKKTPEVLVDWTPEEEQLMETQRKIDWRTIPYLSFVFGLSLLDRTNVSVAYIAGMSEDLDLAVGSRYSIALLPFFIPYMMCEIPSNMIIRRIGTRWWLTALILYWGVCILAMGFVKHWVPLVILRIFLGAFEAGLFPGALYILSAWYRTYESGQKVSIFYMASLVTTGFNGIFAYALSRISVGNGMFSSGWKWILIIEGAMTIAAGVAGPFLLAESPEKSTWLTERERHIAIRRVANDNAGRDYEHLNWKKQLKLLKDWKIAVYIYSLGYFLPLTLRESLGFSHTKAQLLFSPPYMFCIIMSILSGWVSDRLRIRWIFLVVQAAIGIAGLFIILFVHAPYVRYFGVFLVKKGIISAAMISAGAIGGITGSTIFRVQDAPRYLPGMGTTIAFQALYIVLTAGMSYYFKKKNKEADEKGTIPEGVPGFRYAP
ncbi:major facilitator superfamily transporter [Fusarium subglutinans]|uniref:Major facilitator superfamily transporter n=1 Tax=Gibberella subglutinans TaxID=42677 RepID=A0A8H5UPE1_GIBSU|nr:major facilitator superfamily transporter [Fusarium subglutinans]KAF5592655.1 major facilitator superfamily transporter [Fusarium subglutinans]